MKTNLRLQIYYINKAYIYLIDVLHDVYVSLPHCEVSQKKFIENEKHIQKMLKN